jgi:electron transport complex protein RnfB
MKIYEKLRDKLSATPTGVPNGDDFLEILSILFTEDEAALALILPFMPAPLEEIASASGLDMEEAERLLSNMADKGVVYAFEKKGTKMFMLFDVVWVLFKFPLMTKLPGIDYERLRSLWDNYLGEGLGGNGEVMPRGEQLPMGRVLPIQEDISNASQALPQDLVYQYIDEATYISVGECSCKKTVRACDSPTEVCMALGHEAHFLAERGMARLIDKDEAKAIVKMAHDAGLVSVTSNVRKKINLICHCCSCCCAQLGVATRHGRYDLRPVGAYVADIDESCAACGSCIDRCPMKAISIDEGAGGTIASVDQGKCIGCGLCVSSCPEESITLKKRTPAPEVPDNIIEWTKKAVEVRGVADRFMQELTVKRRGEDT